MFWWCNWNIANHSRADKLAPLSSKRWPQHWPACAECHQQATVAPQSHTCAASYNLAKLNLTFNPYVWDLNFMSTKLFKSSEKCSSTISANKQIVKNINNKTSSLILHYFQSLSRRIVKKKTQNVLTNKHVKYFTDWSFNLQLLWVWRDSAALLQQPVWHVPP